MEPVTITVKLVFGEVLVIGETVMSAEFFGGFPGFGFELKANDILVKIAMLIDSMTQFMQQEKMKIWLVWSDMNGFWGAEKKTGAGFEAKFRIVGF